MVMRNGVATIARSTSTAMTEISAIPRCPRSWAARRFKVVTRLAISGNLVFIASIRSRRLVALRMGPASGFATGHKSGAASLLLARRGLIGTGLLGNGRLRVGVRDAQHSVRRDLERRA